MTLQQFISAISPWLAIAFFVLIGLLIASRFVPGLSRFAEYVANEDVEKDLSGHKPLSQR